MKTKKSPRSERIRNFLLQLDVTKKRDKELIDILETEFLKGIGYKEYIMMCIETRKEADELRQILKVISNKNEGGL